MARMEMELEEIVHGHPVDLRTAADLVVRFRTVSSPSQSWWRGIMTP